MELQLTREWVADLRRDLKAWDIRVKEGRPYLSGPRTLPWPDMTPPLKYMGSEAELGPGGRKRRASTGGTMGSGRNPPSEMYNWECEGPVALYMRMPAHVWAMLSRGREAASVWMVQVVDGTMQMIRYRQRWQEWDGERHWDWRDSEGDPLPQEWKEWQMQRMVWVKKDGTWHGEWRWEEYDREVEWDDFRSSRRPCNERSQSSIASRAPWNIVPQEVLLGMVRELENAEDRKGLAAASGVCHAWLNICAPSLYREIGLCSSRIMELVENLSRTRSCIAQHAEVLKVRGPVPWMALPKVLKLLARLSKLIVREDKDVPRRVYHPAAPRLTFGIHVAFRTALTLTFLWLHDVWFLSTGDVLRLLAFLPCLSSALLMGCTIQTGSTTAPLVSSTHLNLVVLTRDRGGVHWHESAASSLAQWWKWPHDTKDPGISPYPGLHRADAQKVVAIIRAADMLGWGMVSLSVRGSWHADSWVLVAVIESPCLNLEFHVVSASPESFASTRSTDHGARVEYIVVRLNTLDLGVRDLLGRKMLECMEDPMLRLPHLRTVTLETRDAGGHAGLAEKLEKLRASGRLCLRTHKEAQQAALLAKLNPCSYSEDQGIVSPLWYLDEHIPHRAGWLEPESVVRGPQGRAIPPTTPIVHASLDGQATSGSVEDNESDSPSEDWTDPGSLSSTTPSSPSLLEPSPVD